MGNAPIEVRRISFAEVQAQQAQTELLRRNNRGLALFGRLDTAVHTLTKNWPRRSVVLIASAVAAFVPEVTLGAEAADHTSVGLALFTGPLIGDLLRPVSGFVSSNASANRAEKRLRKSKYSQGEKVTKDLARVLAITSEIRTEEQIRSVISSRAETLDTTEHVVLLAYQKLQQLPEFAADASFREAIHVIMLAQLHAQLLRGTNWNIFIREVLPRALDSLIGTLLTVSATVCINLMRKGTGGIASLADDIAYPIIYIAGKYIPQLFGKKPEAS